MFKRKSSSDALTLMAAKVVSANLMIADNDLKIVYMNDAVTDLLRAAESDLKKELPHFNVDTLVGTNIDVFHKNPQHQRKMLASLSDVHRATIQIGNRKFDLVATPVKGSDGSRTGVVVEWSDASVRLQNLDFGAQVAAANRSQAVIEFNMDGTVRSGDLSDRVGLSRGFAHGQAEEGIADEGERHFAAGHDVAECARRMARS